MGPKLLLGFHISISESLSSAFDGAVQLGCTTFQIFTRNPRQWQFRPLDDGQVTSFRQRRRETNFDYVVAHMPYLPNLASPLKVLKRQSRASLTAEVKRCDSLGIDYLVAHLGSHMGKGSVVGIGNIAEACNEALGGSRGKTVLLLENMAGQKNCIGARFEELRSILDLVKKKDRVGICLDTCHLLAAGFDITSKQGVERTMSLVDEILGFDEVKTIHLNDSKGGLGSALDRHEHIGLGKIGFEGFRALLHYEGISELPILMETPVDKRRSDEQNMALVKKLAA